MKNIFKSYTDQAEYVQPFVYAAMAVRITMALAATIAVTVAVSTPVKAAPYEGRYVIYFGGLTIGAMQAKLYVTDNEYNLKLDIRAKGVSELVTNFAATTELGGIIEQGKLVSHGYELRWQDDGEEKYARLNQTTSPLTFETNRKIRDRDDISNPIDINQVGTDTLDPITALLSVSPDGSISSLCDRQQKLFDGSRLAQIKASVAAAPSYIEDEEDKEAQGTPFKQSCRVKWTPIGGYRQKTTDAAGEAEPIYIRYQQVGETMLHAPEHIEVETEYGTIVIVLKDSFVATEETQDNLIRSHSKLQNIIQVRAD